MLPPPDAQHALATISFIPKGVAKWEPKRCRKFRHCNIAAGCYAPMWAYETQIPKLFLQLEDDSGRSSSAWYV
jgi:hypothetical protein